MDKVAQRKKGLPAWAAMLLIGIAFGIGGSMGYFKGLRDGYGQAAGDIERFVKEGVERQLALAKSGVPAPQARGGGHDD